MIGLPGGERSLLFPVLASDSLIIGVMQSSYHALRGLIQVNC